MTSLIQRRMAIDRQRLSGTYSLVSGAAIATISCLEIAFDGPSALHLLLGLIGIISLIAGTVARIRAHRALVAFEAAEGVGAGAQPPRSSQRRTPEN